jgi:hypothetical protein
MIDFILNNYDTVKYIIVSIIILLLAYNTFLNLKEYSNIDNLRRK